MSKNSNNQKKQGRQIAAVCLVVCLVAVLAIAGTYISRQYDTGNSQAAAETEESSVKNSDSESAREASQNGTEGNADGTQTDDTQDSASDGTEAASSGLVLNTDEEGNTTQSTQEDTQKDDSAQSNEGNEAQAAETSVAPQSGLSLEWPVEGNVIMSYSMDKTVYFKTLNQYKYNPAMLIGGNAGDEVKSSASGTVSSVGVDAQTGTTVTMNMGSGYSVVYGQLKEVKVSEGDYLDAGDTIGYLSEPTKYYTEEGCNLYYQVLKNGKSVNPMDYLNEE